MTIEEIVKKHKRWLKYTNNKAVLGTLKEDLKAAGFHVKTLTLEAHKLVIRTENELFVETF